MRCVLIRAYNVYWVKVSDDSKFRPCQRKAGPRLCFFSVHSQARPFFPSLIFLTETLINSLTNQTEIFFSHSHRKKRRGGCFVVVIIHIHLIVIKNLNFCFVWPKGGRKIVLGSCERTESKNLGSFLVNTKVQAGRVKVHHHCGWQKSGDKAASPSADC
ncbi:hypothetical protein H5410_047479 [Solanum commersonii]|uniref:Uncharacterized protein n=1 Tax=Solanum commersonii TaxID=4109 RepID=A0A9J5XH64_SOLCO|nr:hypothetical protein H5410_047479 [Solanum commersonii]